MRKWWLCSKDKLYEEYVALLRTEISGRVGSIRKFTVTHFLNQQMQAFYLLYYTILYSKISPTCVGSLFWSRIAIRHIGHLWRSQCDSVARQPIDLLHILPRFLASSETVLFQIFFGGLAYGMKLIQVSSNTNWQRLLSVLYSVA
jgi:hypothetical protein